MTIAVVIPAYNVEKYVADCLDSVLSQTYPDFRIYIMNDGSKDNTWKIIQKYARKDERIHAFTHKNQGVTKTRNALLDKLDHQIDFLFYMDADDFIHPQTFECLLSYMKKYPTDVVECGIQYVETNKHPKNFSKLVFPKEQASYIQDMSIFWSDKTRKGVWKNAVNKLYRWPLVKNIRFSERLAFEDDYFYSCLVNAQIHSKVIISDVLYNYRVNPTSATHKIDFEKYLSCGINRIQLSYDTFLKTHSVPKKYVADFKYDLAQDAYRMIVRKNLKKNKNVCQCRELFQKASQAICRFDSEKIVDFSTLSLLKKWALLACQHQWFYLTKILVYLAG